ncbi:MAG: 4-demethylwyosine synthase TYW1 [Nanoarchaeota archaeon]|nr:4-demethylwyosine synthase TYW1 [Nanoarchaeota archaeon]MBU4124074.1 4-demethylwyosine synthase TYW1 [Nanoarchaeota archaeon]
MKNLSKEMLSTFKKQHYKIIGEHSAAKLCHWTKESIKTGGKRHCYKEQFYSDIGVKSHRCLQCTTSLTFCSLRCLFCWRKTELTRGIEFSKKDSDDPKFIVSNLIKAQGELLNGLGGVPHSSKYLKEAYTPTNIAISLSGEPFSHNDLSEVIREFKNRGATVFLVTNGTFPEKIEKLDNLPTQLYVSLSANSEQMMKKVQNPLIPNAWGELNKTLELFPSLNTRKVIRLTMIKNLNMTKPELYAKLIEKASPQFIEIKAYMSIGYSRDRLGPAFMPTHEEIIQFAKEIEKHSSYKIAGEQRASRVVLLKR